MDESLITLSQLDEEGIPEVYFGTSKVEFRQLGEGSTHKAARKEARSLANFFSPLFDFKIGTRYIYHTQKGMVFTETEFPDGGIFYLGSRTTNGVRLDPSKPIQFVGGMCIGGSSTLIGVDEDDNQHNILERETPEKLQQPIVDIKCQTRISVYEADTILKLTSLMSALANGMNDGQKNRLTFHLPIPEYLLYILQYYQNGVLDQGQASEIAKIIRKRGHGLKVMLQKRFSGISGLDEVIISSPLEDYIPDDFLLLSATSLDQMASDLASQDPLWKSIIYSTQPETWTDLADCSYQSLYLRLSQEAHGYNLVGVENPEELSILLAAKKTASGIEQPFSMACLYPHSHVFTTSGTPKRLFRHKSISPLRDIKKVLIQY